MTTSSWRLTVEEIAFLLSLRQQSELAQSLLRAQLGPLTKENVMKVVEDGFYTKEQVEGK